MIDLRDAYCQQLLETRFYRPSAHDGFQQLHTLLHDVWSLMKKRKLLHVPIVGNDLRPLGVINARDALLVLLEGSEYEERLMRDYVMGIGYR